MHHTTARVTLLMAAMAIFASAPFGKAAVIDWDLVPWVDGTAVQSLDLNADTVADIQVSITGSVLASTPLDGPAPYTGGLFPHKALQLWTDPGTPGGMDVAITFLPGGLYDLGVRNLTYGLFDVDGDGAVGSGTDFITGSLATYVAGGTTTPASMTPTAPFNTLTGPDSAMGLAIANDNSAQGTVTTVYGNTAVRSFVFHYDNPISPANGIALGDMSFDFDVAPVPEAGTVAACAVAALVGAWGLRRMRSSQAAA
jgi:hypothetical protein